MLIFNDLVTINNNSININITATNNFYLEKFNICVYWEIK